MHMLSKGPVQVKPLCGISSIFESVKSLDSSLLHVDKTTLVEPRPADVGTCRSTGLLQGAEDTVEEASFSSDQGFLKECITYMVTDSLEIMPSTTIRSIKVLNRLKVASLADLRSSDITVSITQVLQLLQSAMTSSSCLNDVFGKV